MDKQIKTISRKKVEQIKHIPSKTPFYSVIIDGLDVRTFDPEVINPEGMPGLKKGMVVEKLDYTEIEKEKKVKGKVEKVIYRTIIPPIILEGGKALESPKQEEASSPHQAQVLTQVQTSSLISSPEEAMQRAIRNPRDAEIALTGSLNELDMYFATLDPKEDQKVYYSIPHKNEFGSISMIEGPSIKAAMVLFRHWGNCDSGGRVVPGSEDDRQIICEGVYIDLEKNIRTQREAVVRKVERRKKGGGTFVRINEDRLKVMIQKGISIAIRNACLNGIPLWYSGSFFKRSKQLEIARIGTKAPDVKKHIERFIKLVVSQRKIPESNVRDYIKEREEEFKNPKDMLAHLTGLWNALEDGQVDANTIFLGEKTESQEEGLPLSKAEAESGAPDLNALILECRKNLDNKRFANMEKMLESKPADKRTSWLADYVTEQKDKGWKI